jgi:hypothetical protein
MSRDAVLLAQRLRGLFDARRGACTVLLGTDGLTWIVCTPQGEYVSQWGVSSGAFSLRTNATLADACEHLLDAPIDPETVKVSLVDMSL